MGCETVPCAICEKPVYICELDCSNQSHSDGCEFSDGKGWACSHDCWELGADACNGDPSERVWKWNIRTLKRRDRASYRAGLVEGARKYKEYVEAHPTEVKLSAAQIVFILPDPVAVVEEEEREERDEGK